MAASDLQMQTYADTRIRPRAEAFRLLLSQCVDDKANITDEYARATSNSAWADGRGDGPPHLLQSGNGTNPDDLLNYNAFITAFNAIFNGSGEDQPTKAGYIDTIRSSFPVFQRACVRAPQA